MPRWSFQNRLLTALVFALLQSNAQAGAFIFAGEDYGTDLIAHPNGWSTSTRGELEVRVCIGPGTPNAGVMVKAVQNIVDRFNLGVATVGNVRLGADNDVNSSEIDFESTAAHEVGHCLGLAHSNLATESGQSGEDQNFTKSTDGGDNIFNLNVGPDGVRGSQDDARGDDVNLHWFEIGVNDPFDVADVVDETNYSNATFDLPVGDDFAANGDRDVSVLLGYPLTEALMQQGAFFDEDQRALAADDIATLRFARNGRDRLADTADDYSVRMVYGGISGSSQCDINLSFDDNETGFAVCQAEASLVTDDYARFTSSNSYFNNSFNWKFSSRRIPYPAADAIVVSELSTATELTTGDTSLLANDIDQTSPQRGLVISATPSRLSTFGVVELHSDGTFSYTNTEAAATQDRFQYRVCVDNTSPPETTCAHQNVEVIIVDNGAPVATDDQLELPEGSAADTLKGGAMSLLDNDIDPEGNETITVSTVPLSQPVAGEVTLNEDGTFHYVHDGLELFTDTFSYEVCDVFGLCDAGVVSVSISEVNDLPTAGNDNLASIAEDSAPSLTGAQQLLANDSPGTGEESQALIITAVSNPTGGEVEWDGESIRFSPAADYAGPAGFTYTVRDDGTTSGEPDPQSASASVGFTISEVNDPPVAQDDEAPAVMEDSPAVMLPTASLTQNDLAGPVAESNQILTVTDLTNVVGGSAILAAGSIEFLLNPDFNGIASFQYTLSDNGTTAGVSDPMLDVALVSFEVSEVNDSPEPVPDTLGSVAEGTGVQMIPVIDLLSNDRPGPDDETAQALTLIAVKEAQGGAVSIQGEQVVFSIDDEYSGTATFTYTVEDNGTTNGQPDPRAADAEVSIMVVGQNDPPVAVDDIVGDQSSGDVATLDPEILLANDVPGPEAEANQTLTVIDVFGANGGTVGLSGGMVVFAVDSNFSGEASFSYRIQDNGTTDNSPDFQEAIAQVSFTVSAENLAPLARADAMSVVRGSSSGQLDSKAVRLINNDLDPNGDTLLVSAIPAIVPSAGSVSINADGTFDYQHDGGPQALDRFAYEVCDATENSRCSTAEVAVVVADIPLNKCTSSVIAAVVGLPVVVPYEQAFPALPLDYEAEGLPGSISLDTSTGVVTGTPEQIDVAGSPYEIVITGTSAAGAQFQRVFSLLITAEAEITFYSGNEQSCGL